MFTKKPEDAAKPELPPTRVQVASQRPRPAPRGSGNDAATVIGAGLTITGNLNPRARCRSRARCRAISTPSASSSAEQAHITGALIAEEIVVRGNVQGLGVKPTNSERRSHDADDKSTSLVRERIAMQQFYAMKIEN